MELRRHRLQRRSLVHYFRPGPATPRLPALDLTSSCRVVAPLGSSLTHTKRTFPANALDRRLPPGSATEPIPNMAALQREQPQQGTRSAALRIDYCSQGEQWLW